MMISKNAVFYGYNPPFLGGQQNYMSRQEDDRLIKNDILQLLLTIPGERVMRPDYGVNLRNFVFEQLSSNDLTSLEQEITVKINKYEPRVTIQSIALTADNDRNGLQIKIVVYLKKDPQRQLLIEQFIKGVQA
jgi:phage baseplate assembly protein W